jgi:hypothetical protein
MRNTTVPPTTSRNRFDPGYECELPPSARRFILNRKRPRILARPKPGKKVRGSGWLYLLLLAAVLLGIVGVWTASQRKPVHERVLVPEPITAPTPTIIPRSSTVPRAELVKLPPPRAQLVRLPEWRIGEERLLTMPYGIQTLGTLRGRLLSEDTLPLVGNRLGDTFVVGDTAWVWITQPGATQASWIDP